MASNCKICHNPPRPFTKTRVARIAIARWETRPMKESKPKDIRHIMLETDLVGRALRKAVVNAMIRHKRLGNPIVVWRRGKSSGFRPRRSRYRTSSQMRNNRISCPLPRDLPTIPGRFGNPPTRDLERPVHQELGKGSGCCQILMNSETCPRESILPQSKRSSFDSESARRNATSRAKSFSNSFSGPDSQACDGLSSTAAS